jgi:hypothetical protein
LRLGLLGWLWGRPGNIEGTGRRARHVAGTEAEIVGIARRHRGDIGHGLRLKLDDPRFELSIDPPQKRADVEIEHRAVGVDDPARLRPWGERMERALLERLHHFRPGPNARREVHF